LRLRAGKSFTYDAFSRNLTQVGPNGTISSAWDAADRKMRLTYTDGFYVDYDYLTTGELLKVRENGATSAIGVLASFGYDNLGNRTSLTFGNGVVESYGYDPVSRLASLSHDEGGTTYDQSLTFTYNPASQIVTRIATNDAYAFTGYANESTAGAANGLNQLTSVGGVPAGHDARGNVTSDPTTGNGYGYSSENLLSSATMGTNSYALSYDPLTRLSSISGAPATSFGYDGLDMIDESQNGAIVTHHVFDPDTGQPLVTQYGTSSHLFLSPDERGSVMASTSNAGSLLYGNPYDEFGRPMPWSTFRYLYTGQAWLTAAIAGSFTHLGEMLRAGFAAARGASAVQLFFEGAATAAGSSALWAFGLAAGGAYAYDQLSGGKLTAFMSKNLLIKYERCP
jgi:hypothetical protein